MVLRLPRRPSRGAPARTHLRSALAVGVVAALSATATVAQATEPTGATLRLSGELVVAVGQDPHAGEHPGEHAGEHAEDHPGEHREWESRIAAVRTSDGRLHPVDADDVDDVEPGSQVVATVTAGAGPAPADVRSITVADTAQGTAAATQAATVSTHQVFAVLVTPAGVTPGTDVTETTAATLIDRAAAFWAAQSDDALTFTHAGTTPAYTSAYTCDQPWKLWEEAARRTPGYTHGAPGQHLALFLPYAAYTSGGCSYGLGSVGSSTAGVASGGVLYVADFSTAALAHELGHNLSLQHANAFRDAVGEESDTDDAVPYGDRADVMGPGFRDQSPYTHGNLSAVQQARLGLLSTAHRATVTGTGTSTRTLAAVDRTAAASSSAPRLLTVTDPRTGLRYSVEYRAARGWDANNPFRVVSGVRVLRDSTVHADETVLVDTTPASGSTGDQSLTVGRTWTSLSGGVRLTVTGTAADAATVTVDLVGDAATPTVTVAAPDATWFTPGHLTASLDPATATGTVAFSTRTGTAAWQPVGTATVAGGIAQLPWTPEPTVADARVQVRADFVPDGSASLAASGVLDVTPGSRPTSTSVLVGGVVGSVSVLAAGTPAQGTVDVTLTHAATGETLQRPVTLVPGPTPLDLTGLAAGTWTVRAAYRGDDGVWGHPVSQPSTSMPVSTVVAGVPDAPTGVTAVAGDGSATVTWTAPADNGSPITRYTVTASPSGVRASVTAGTSATLTGLPNGVDHTFTVRASNGAGTGPASAPSPAVRYVPLTDVAPDDRFAADIGWLVRRGVTGGYADGTFRPTAPVSRQAMAAFLYRFDGGTEVPVAPSPFLDVPDGATFHREIQWLSARGISTGSPQPDGTRAFKPVDAVSRQAMAAFLYRFADSPAFTAPATPTFADVPLGSPFFREVEWLASTGLTTGTTLPDRTTVFRPGDAVSRQAMAAFLHRLAVHLDRD